MEVAPALQSLVALLEDDDPRTRADIYTEDATFVMPGISVIQRRAEMLRQMENGTLLRSVVLPPSTIEARRATPLARESLDFRQTDQR